MTSMHAVHDGARAPGRATTFLVLALLVAPVGLPVVGAGTVPIEETVLEDIVSRSTTVPAPAVAERQDGTLVGIAGRLDITVQNGTGSVYVDTRPFTQLDMQGSARLAATTASALAGEPMEEHDFFVTMRAASPTVGGPSAGGVMTVAFTALLMDWPLRDDVAMTGMINPDGTIGPVGGILEKAEAAANVGASKFLVPEGQSVVTRYVREDQGEGWFEDGTVREERIDVAAYAEEEFGLEVLEVADIHAAVAHFTGYEIARPEPEGEPRSPRYDAIMSEAARTQLDEARGFADTVRDDVAGADLPEAEKDALRDRLGRVVDKHDNASAAVDRGSFYTALSLAFQTRIELREIDLLLGASASDDQRAFLADHGRKVVEDLEDLKEDAAARRPTTVSTLEAVGAAQTRILEAERLVAQGETALQNDLATDALRALAFADERTRSVGMWLDLADAMADVGTEATLQATPAEVATEFFGVAQQAHAYAQTLLGTAGGGLSAQLLQEARRDLEDAAAASEMGLDVGALYLSLESQVASHTALSLVGSENLVQDRIGRQESRALIEIGRTRALGAEPVLAVSYFDFADSLRDQVPTNALLMFGFAATVARTSAVLAGDAGCGVSAAACGEGPSYAFTPEYEVTDPWTGYLALASVVLGFLAGGLVFMVVHDHQRREEEEGASEAPSSGAVRVPPERRRTSVAAGTLRAGDTAAATVPSPASPGGPRPRLRRRRPAAGPRRHPTP